MKFSRVISTECYFLFKLAKKKGANGEPLRNTDADFMVCMPPSKQNRRGKKKCKIAFHRKVSCHPNILSKQFSPDPMVAMEFLWPPSLLL